MGVRCGTTNLYKSRTMAGENRVVQSEELTLENSLKVLFELQRVDARIAHIRMLRGELPMAVEDLEDEIAGLQTRIGNLQDAQKAASSDINTKRHEIKSAEVLIKKYEKQLENVRNNREYDNLTKEVEYQQLEVELRNKQIKELKIKNDETGASIESTKQVIAEREQDLQAKRAELESVIAETAKEEAELTQESERLQAQLPERLLKAYIRICGSVRNGLGVVTVVRGACGGCFRRIPPQRQLDIRSHKRVVVCENCGRIIVDDPTQAPEEAEEAPEEVKPMAKRRRRAEK